jgi:hypothetical protein
MTIHPLLLDSYREVRAYPPSELKSEIQVEKTRRRDEHQTLARRDDVGVAFRNHDNKISALSKEGKTEREKANHSLDVLRIRADKAEIAAKAMEKVKIDQREIHQDLSALRTRQGKNEDATRKLKRTVSEQDATKQTADKALVNTLDLYTANRREKNRRINDFVTLDSYQTGIGKMLSGKAVFDTDAIAIDVEKTVLDAGGHTEDLVIRLAHRLLDGGSVSYEKLLPAALLPVITPGGTAVPGNPGFYLSAVAPVAVNGTITWPAGTALKSTVTMTDTSQLSLGDAIEADMQWFEIIEITADTSVVVYNPHGLTLPNGALATTFAGLPTLTAGSLALVVTFPAGTYTLTETLTLKFQTASDDELLGWPVGPITVTYTVI